MNSNFGSLFTGGSNQSEVSLPYSSSLVNPSFFAEDHRHGGPYEKESSIEIPVFVDLFPVFSSVLVLKLLV